MFSVVAGQEGMADGSGEAELLRSWWPGSSEGKGWGKRDLSGSYPRDLPLLIRPVT